MNIYHLNKLLEQYTEDPEELDINLERKQNQEANQKFIDDLYSEEDYIQDYIDKYDINNDDKVKKSPKFFKLRNYYLNKLEEILKSNKNFFNISIIKSNTDGRYNYLQAHTFNINAINKLKNKSKLLQKVIEENILNIKAYHHNGYLVVEIQ